MDLSWNKASPSWFYGRVNDKRCAWWLTGSKEPVINDYRLNLFVVRNSESVSCLLHLSFSLAQFIKEARAYILLVWSCASEVGLHTNSIEQKSLSRLNSFVWYARDSAHRASRQENTRNFNELSILIWSCSSHHDSLRQELVSNAFHRPSVRWHRTIPNSRSVPCNRTAVHKKRETERNRRHRKTSMVVMPVLSWISIHIWRKVGAKEEL